MPGRLRCRCRNDAAGHVTSDKTEYVSELDKLVD